MTDTRSARLQVIVAIGILAAGGCAQHHVARTFVELEPRLKSGQHVHVTTVAGVVRKGTFEALSPKSVRITVAGARMEIAESETAQITVRDPLWRGTIIGGVTGAVVGSLAQQTGEALGCGWRSTDDCVSTVPVAGMVVGATIGGAIGAGLDAWIGKRAGVYAGPGVAPVRVVLSPTPSRRGAGLRLTLIF